MRRLILWDIDGTLIKGGGVGSRALKRAACEVAALVDVPRVDPHGKTDPQILREMFHAAQVDPERIDDFVVAATIGMEQALAELEHELRAKASILPGVVEVLKRIDAIADVRQTLLTGNIAANATIKVAAFGLTDFFDAEVGAYGTDHEDRLELVPIALERVERLRGERYDPNDVWVVGDTPMDLACARAGGVRCLLVGTSAHGYDSVRDLPAEEVLVDLSDVDRVVEILAG
ncbi:MAG: hypothetical protein QOD30_839 [Actinomycetota bacterium]|nr:hypothetical protein [Actinomycetota bacterium]